MIPLDDGGKHRLASLKSSLSAAAGGASDHLALVRLFNDWSAQPAAAQARFAAANYLSNATLRMIQGMRGQLKQELARLGLLRGAGGDVAAAAAAADSSVVRSVLVRRSVTRHSCCLEYSMCQRPSFVD